MIDRPYNINKLFIKILLQNSQSILMERVQAPSEISLYLITLNYASFVSVQCFRNFFRFQIKKLYFWKTINLNYV